ncbi:hypothetical protein OH76DRAFT_1410968 [Lentinus brumalis]|uniref:Arrestin-like N-terminal domain-containing protein n=1 Tax=Lentinus brumalis TaxID=2498619 RepID=A0A371CQS1_9APHY|nr:hypothetical protein OH76DRAFT_1410968 [Polyporus brumalis]
MPPPHPYGVTPIPRPRSSLFLRSRTSSPQRTSTPQPKSSKHRPVEDTPPLPPLPSILPLAPNRSLSPFPPTKADACGHYVRHSSRLTLLLSGQREGACMPLYSNGETIEGVLAIARPSGVLALDVKVEGTIHIQEIAGTGSSTVKTIDAKIYSWDASCHGSFPPRASFRYTLPATYHHLASGKEYPLPPTYAEELHGIPGFIVKISYAVVVNLTLLREASTLWRSVSKCVCSGVDLPLSGDADYVALPRTRSVRVPFRYCQRTRPLIPGPFPSVPEKTAHRPRTLFVYQMRSTRGDAPVIKVHLYLPSSPVCCYQEPIPFHVSVFADEPILDRFAEYRPMPSSFLPLSSSSLNLSYEAMQHQLSARKAAHKCPLRLKVQRMTVVDAGSAGFSFVSFYPRSRHEAVQSLVSREEVVPERRYMYSTQSVGHGVVHSATRRANSVVWSGAIIIPPTQLGFCGGFEASGLQVADSIVLSLDPPPTYRSQYVSLEESVPIRLTSDTAKSQAGIPVSSL